MKEENPGSNLPPARGGKDPDQVGAGLDFTDPHGPLARYYLQTSHVLAVILVGVVAILVGLAPLWHTDVWGHMKFGQWIVANGRLPEHEPFSDLADASAPYINFQWLAQLVLYGAYALGAHLAGGDWLQQTAGGVEMLRTLHAVLTGLRFVFLIAALWRASGSGSLACVGGLIAALLAIANLFVLRPQVIAEVYLAVLLFILSKPQLSVRDLITVPLLMVVWANTHGSYPVGGLVLGARAAGLLVGYGYGRDSRRNLVLGIGVLLLGCGAVLLNPHGPGLLMHTWTFAQNPNIADMDEWKPLSIGQPWGMIFLASLILVGVTQGLRLFVPRDETTALDGPPDYWSPGRFFPLTHGLLLAGFGVQTLLHQRMMPWWVMLVPWILAPHWAVILRGFPMLVADRSVPSLRKTLLAGLAAWACLMWLPVSIWYWAGAPRPLGQSVHAGTPWPLAAELRMGDGHQVSVLSGWLRQQYPEGKFTDRIFTTETQGDFLLWALVPESRSFMYTHVHLFPPWVWQDCQRVKAGAPDWEAILDRHHVAILIAEAELCPQLCERLRAASERWEILVDETGNTAKRDPKGRLLIAVRKRRLG